MKPPPLPDLGAIRERMEDQREEAINRLETVAMKVHTRLYASSNGRIGATALGAPCLLVTVAGRTTGKPRTVALAYATDGDELVLAGSNGGKDKSPDWLENLRQNAAVEVQIGRIRAPKTAEVIERSDLRYERLWRIVNANNRGRYYRYQNATTRPIPLVLLHPA